MGLPFPVVGELLLLGTPVGLPVPAESEVPVVSVSMSDALKSNPENSGLGNNDVATDDSMPSRNGINDSLRLFPVSNNGSLVIATRRGRLGFVEHCLHCLLVCLLLHGVNFFLRMCDHFED